MGGFGVTLASLGFNLKCKNSHCWLTVAPECHKTWSGLWMSDLIPLHLLSEDWIWTERGSAWTWTEKKRKEFDTIKKSQMMGEENSSAERSKCSWDRSKCNFTACNRSAKKDDCKRFCVCKLEIKSLQVKHLQPLVGLILQSFRVDTRKAGGHN